MNTLPMQRYLTDDIFYASMEEVCESVNKATREIAYHHQGFDRMFDLMKSLAVILHFRTGAKDVVCINKEEPQVSPFSMDGSAQEDRNAWGGPGKIFPCPFIVSSIPRGNIACLLSSLSAVASYNMGVACHRKAFTCGDNRRWKYQVQAKQFYQTAYNLLDHLSYISPNGSLVNVYLALCTNLAEIEFEDGNLDASRQWRSALANTMTCVPENRECALFKHFHNACIFFTFETPAANAA